METSLPVAPLERHNRVFVLDVLRGIALLGILMVNMPVFNSPMAVLIGDMRLWSDPVNMQASWFIDFFFHGKFYVLFSFLFGIGFYFFLRKVDEAGKTIVSVFRRRLLFLLIFGILHIVFLWYGDILFIYALFGFVMTWFRNKSDRTVLLWAIGFLVFPLVLTGLMVLMIQFAMGIPEAAAEMEAGFQASELQLLAMADRAMEVYASGSFFQILSIRLMEYAYALGGILTFFPFVLAMFLTGMLAGRRGYLQNSGKNVRFFKKLFWLCLPIALASNWLLASFIPVASHVHPDVTTIYMLLGFAIGGPSMAFVYISLVVFALHKGYFSWLAKKLAITGRMALTNYLTQSIICTTLFYSYGFGLYGKVDIIQGIFITLAIFVVQVIWSQYWMKRFRFGPMEWVWRSLTYNKMQAFLKTPSEQKA